LSQQTSFLVYCEQMGDDLCVNSLYSGLWKVARIRATSSVSCRGSYASPPARC
jgi:hypothetical protein